MIDQFIIVNGVWLTMVNPALQLTAVAAMPAYVNTTITDNKVNKFVFVLMTSAKSSESHQTWVHMCSNSNIGLFISHQVFRVVSSQQLDLNV